MASTAAATVSGSTLSDAAALLNIPRFAPDCKNSRETLQNSATSARGKADTMGEDEVA
jgi:hypothetical protein